MMRNPDQVVVLLFLLTELTEVKSCERKTDRSCYFLLVGGSVRESFQVDDKDLG
jgi:hypothetical protein